MRIRKDGATGSGFSAPVSLVYDPTVTPSSPNPVRTLSIHWTTTSLVVRWSLVQDTGVSQRLFFRSGDGQTTVLLTPVALPSSVVSYTLASQALSVPCGSLYLETAAGAASPAPGLPSSVAGEQGAGRDPCAGDPPAQEAPSGPYFVNWYHHRDHLGTLRNVTDEAGYVKIGYDDYPYGARMPQSATPSVGGSTRQYTGHERDAATGLDYMMARYYGAGKFLSADRLVTQGPESPSSWNLYACARNSPANLVDPDGRKELPPTEADKKAVEKEAGTRTPFYLPDGSVNPEATNCHTHAWHPGQPDPDDPENASIKDKAPLWDNAAEDEIDEQRAVQLDDDEPNLPGDRVVWYGFEPSVGRYMFIHSGVVEIVDAAGNTIWVRSKHGENEIFHEHPALAPYNGVRIYFRLPQGKGYRVPIGHRGGSGGSAASGVAIEDRTSWPGGAFLAPLGKK